ncbi:MAG TPA: hypothetical protein VGD80_27215 [Kofleriaceae bacterium]
MAFLKETERSLRAYFIFVGVIGTLIALSSLSDASKGTPIKSMLVTAAIWFPPLAHLVLGPAFVIAGIRLRRALESGAPGTRQLVKIAALVLVADGVLYLAALNSIGAGDTAELAGRAFGRALIPLLILWYIHASLRRLADESQQRVVSTVADKFG